MKPPGKTTLPRMQAAAHNEATRIEISQDGRVSAGMLKEPMLDQVRLRDDFAGIVKLIDLIESDQVILDRLKKRMEQTERLPVETPAATSDDEEEDAAK